MSQEPAIRRSLTLAEVEQRRAAAVKHGAASADRIRPVARNHRRRVLRQLRLRASDVDAVGLAYLDAYVKLRAKIDLIDAYVGEHGLIRADGELQPVMRLYVALQNSARLALQRLEEHLRTSGHDPSMVVLLQQSRGRQ